MTQGTAVLHFKRASDKREMGMALYERVGDEWRVTVPHVGTGKGYWYSLPGDWMERQVEDYIWKSGKTYGRNTADSEGKHYPNIFARIEYH